MTLVIVALHCEYFHMLTIISIEWHDDDVVLCESERLLRGGGVKHAAIVLSLDFGDDGGAKQ